VPEGLFTVRPPKVEPVTVWAPVPLNVIVDVVAGVNVPRRVKLPPTVTLAPALRISVPSVRSPVVVSDPEPVIVNVPSVMLTLCTVDAVDSVGCAVAGAAAVIVRSSPGTGTPFGLQLLAVVHDVVVPTHVRAVAAVLITRFLFAPREPAAAGDA